MDVYNQSLYKMIPYFSIGTYSEADQERLQKDFRWLIHQDVVLDALLKPSDLNPKRIKICKVCGDIFYAADKKNRQRICKNKPYLRHRKDGTPFRSVIDKSACHMKYKAKWKREYDKHRV